MVGQDAQAENTVYVGKNRTSHYVSAVASISERFNTLRIKARGFLSSKALDVALLSERNLEDFEIPRPPTSGIMVGTEIVKSNKGHDRGDTKKVSSIEFKLERV